MDSIAINMEQKEAGILSIVSKKRKRKELDVSMKIRLIEDVENGMKRVHAAKKYGVGKSTIYEILKAKDKWRDTNENSKVSRFRNVKTKFSEINEKLLIWFEANRDEHVPISRQLLRKKAEQFAEQLNITNFRASEGWLHKWKKRNIAKEPVERNHVDNSVATTKNNIRNKTGSVCSALHNESINMMETEAEGGDSVLLEYVESMVDEDVAIDQTLLGEEAEDELTIERREICIPEEVCQVKTEHDDQNDGRNLTFQEILCMLGKIKNAFDAKGKYDLIKRQLQELSESIEKEITIDSKELSVDK